MAKYFYYCIDSRKCQIWWLGWLILGKTALIYSVVTIYFGLRPRMRNLQEQVKKAFCYQKLFWPFTVWINCSSDLKIFVNSWPSASNFKSFFRSLEHFFLTVGQNNFDNKIPFLMDNPLQKFQTTWLLYLSTVFCLNFTYSLEKKKHPYSQKKKENQINWYSRCFAWFKSSTCPLTSFFWLLSHVIYLKLTRIL